MVSGPSLQIRLASEQKENAYGMLKFFFPGPDLMHLASDLNKFIKVKQIVTATSWLRCLCCVLHLKSRRPLHVNLNSQLEDTLPRGMAYCCGAISGD